ncbi:MAG: DUF401 family protein [Thermoplasmata archaeon]
MTELIGVLIAFVVLGVLIYRKVDFGLSILIASGIMLAFIKPDLEGLQWLFEISIEYDTLELVAAIVLIGYLGYIYRDSEQVDRLILSLRGIFKDRRVIVASIPAVFGLMPMPGGALVSAPMIQDEGDALGLDGVHKAFINWWFRHIWFSVYPISLGLIITSKLSGVNIYRIALFNSPIFIASIVIGTIWGLGYIRKEENVNSGQEKKRGRHILSILWWLSPIFLALGLNLAFNVPFFISLAVSVMFLILQNHKKYSLRKVPLLLKDGFSVNLLMAAYGIMLFKGIVERSEALVPAVDVLQSYIPILAVVIISSLFIGMIMGHLPAAVGIGLPVLIPLLPVVNVQTIAMVYLFIMLGYLISPIHLCIILTIEYFEADLSKFYKRAKISILLLAASIVVWLFIRGSFFYF